MQPVTIWRRITQIGFFVVTGEWLAIGWLRCPFGVPFVSCPSCPSTDCPGKYLFVPFLFIIGLGSLLFGRAFCGWGCPMGLVEDVLGKLPKPGEKFRQRFARADAVLKWLKWPMLAFVIWAVLTYNYQPLHRSWEYVVRTASIFNLQSYQLAWEIGGGAYAIRFWLLVVALVGGLLISRFWCRYLCPLGALLSIFNRFSIFRVHKDEDACIHCGKYPRECIQYTVPETQDCIVCGDCVRSCPAKCISFGPRLAAKKQPEEAEQPTDN